MGPPVTEPGPSAIFRNAAYGSPARPPYLSAGSSTAKFVSPFNCPFGAPLSVVLILFLLAMFVWTRRIRAPAVRGAMIGFGWPARRALILVAGFVLVLLYGPLAVAVFFSFFRLQRNEVDWDSFSFDAYVALPQNEGIVDALVNTAIVGGAAVALSLAIGTLLAFYYQGSRSRLRHLVQLAIFLPFLMPPIITGLSLLTFFRQVEIDRSLLTVVIATPCSCWRWPTASSCRGCRRWQSLSRLVHLGPAVQPSVVLAPTCSRRWPAHLPSHCH